MHRRSPATTLLLSSFWNISDASDPTVALCFCRVLWAEDIHPRSNLTWYTNSHEWGFRETGEYNTATPTLTLELRMTNLFGVFVASARLFPERAEHVTSGCRASAGHTTRGAARRSRPAREPLPTTTTVFLRFSGGYYRSSYLWS